MVFQDFSYEPRVFLWVVDGFFSILSESLAGVFSLLQVLSGVSTLSHRFCPLLTVNVIPSCRFAHYLPTARGGKSLKFLHPKPLLPEAAV